MSTVPTHHRGPAPVTPRAAAGGAVHPDPETPNTTTRRGDHTVRIPSSIPMVGLLGVGDAWLTVLEERFPEVTIAARGDEIRLVGPVAEVALLEAVIDELVAILRTGHGLDLSTVMRTVDMLQRRESERPVDVLTTAVLSHRGRQIRPKTLNQKRYVDAIERHTVVFGIGPAGTGKTYLAVAKAVQALQAKQVSRIILTRPAVEAGERLGYLPGTLAEKIDPYLRPLYDALHEMLDVGTVPRLMTEGVIEIAPLAYMRGRTLNDAFIILDEAQNTSREQMKMFLTRLGFNSTMVITGDVTQIDLPAGTGSGLKQAEEILTGIDDVAFCRLTSYDVVRHSLVGEIVDAYGRYDQAQEQAAAGRERPTYGRPPRARTTPHNPKEVR